MAYQPVKKTSFLEAVEACVQHEKHVSEFYERNSRELKDGEIRRIFAMLSKDLSEHIALIEKIRVDVMKTNIRPDLHTAADVQRFHNSSLHMLMRRLDRNTGLTVGENEIEALLLAAREHEDSSRFYRKMAERFEDPSIHHLFRTLSFFQEENRLLIMSYLTFLPQGKGPQFYWEDDEFHNELKQTEGVPAKGDPLQIKRKIRKSRAGLRKRTTR
jgi:rubrerythrin